MKLTVKIVWLCFEFKISLLEECRLLERALEELHKIDPKIVDKALCRGSGLYAQSLMIGAVIGAIFGGFVAKVINSTIPGNWRHMLWLEWLLH
ncbi:hypothetical protein RIF29_38374 [Crotalaria pallida]|uniref:Uncharacterized protein n=1 Tax=Crotalaria pallida TaxID=3830 RepID=A0AAN9HNW0_CROPI